MFTRQNSPYIDLFNNQLDNTWSVLSEDNLKFTEFLQPLKNFHTSESNLLAFSLSKYLEVSDEVAFWLEILSQNCFLFNNLHILDVHNLDVLKQKYNKLPTSPKLQFHLSRTCSLQQIQWMQSWIWETHLKILAQFPNLRSVLNQSFWHKHLYSKYGSISSFFEDRVIMGDLLHEIGNGFGLFEIKLPVLIGFTYSAELYPKHDFKSEDWHLLENFLHQISTVHGILNQKDDVLSQFLYYNKLTETQKDEWWLMSEVERKHLSEHNEEIKLAISSIISQFDQNLNSDLANLNFPPEFIQFLEELCVWVFKPASELV